MHVILTQSRVDLRWNGPKIRIRVRHPKSDIEAAKRVGRELPPGMVITAIIDTGASVTVINPEVAATCGLRPTGPARLSAVGHVITVSEYSAAIDFVEHPLNSFDPLRVVASTLPRQEGVSCLLGRDILERWAIHYDGRTGEMWVDE